MADPCIAEWGSHSISWLEVCPLHLSTEAIAIRQCKTVTTPISFLSWVLSFMQANLAPVPLLGKENASLAVSVETNSWEIMSPVGRPLALSYRYLNLLFYFLFALLRVMQRSFRALSYPDWKSTFCFVFNPVKGLSRVARRYHRAAPALRNRLPALEMKMSLAPSHYCPLPVGKCVMLLSLSSLVLLSGSPPRTKWPRAWQVQAEVCVPATFGEKGVARLAEL